MVSDAAIAYQLHDLQPREGKYMCEQCSNAAQSPLFHAAPADCPRATMPANLEQPRAAMVTPDPSRIEGPQLATKKRKKGPKKSKSEAVGEFPCKSQLCGMLHYTTHWGANKHMLIVHPTEGLVPYAKTAARSTAAASSLALEPGTRSSSSLSTRWQL